MLWLLGVVGILGGPLVGGLCLYYLKKIRGEPVCVETAFEGCRVALLQLFLAGLVGGVLTLVGLPCLILPGVILAGMTIFALALVIDKQLDFRSALKLSGKTIMNQWRKLFTFMVVLALLCFAGVLALGAGLFLTAPIALASLMYAYEDIFGPNGRAASKLPPQVPSLGKIGAADFQALEKSRAVSGLLGCVWLMVAAMPAIAMGPFFVAPRMAVEIIAVLGLILFGAVRLTLRAPAQARGGMSKLAVMFGTLALICVVIAIAVRPASGPLPNNWALPLALLYTLFAAFLWRSRKLQPATGFDYGAPIVGVVILTLGMLLGGPLFPQHAQPLANEFIAAVIVGMGLLALGGMLIMTTRANLWRTLPTGVAIWLAGCCAFLGTQVWSVKDSAERMERAMSAKLAQEKKALMPSMPASARASRLQFRLVADAGDTAPAETLADQNDRSGNRMLRLRKEVLLDESAVARASVVVSPEGGVSVEVDFNEAGGKRFAEITGANIGKRLAVVFDGNVLSAPTIMSVIHDKAVITGKFTVRELAETIAKALNASKGTYHN